MHLVIAKVDQVFFDGNAESVTVPGSQGEMTILGEHMPLITTLRPGTVTVRVDGNEQSMQIEGGILEVNREGATVVL
jgi:F-type H+-transporting ATPase subunit epsilon